MTNLRQTFFDLEFDPDIVLGPSVFDFIHDYFTRHNCSLDSVVTVIQVRNFHLLTKKILTGFKACLHETF